VEGGRIESEGGGSRHHHIVSYPTAYGYSSPAHACVKALCYALSTSLSIIRTPFHRNRPGSTLELREIIRGIGRHLRDRAIERGLCRIVGHLPLLFAITPLQSGSKIRRLIATRRSRSLSCRDVKWVGYTCHAPGWWRCAKGWKGIVVEVRLE